MLQFRHLPLGLCLLAININVSASPAGTKPLDIGRIIFPDSVLDAALAPDGQHVVFLANRDVEFPTELTSRQQLPALIYKRREVLLYKVADESIKTIDAPRTIRYGTGTARKEPQAVQWITNTIVGIDYGIDAESQDLEGNVLCELGTEILFKAIADPNSPLVLVHTDQDRQKVAQVDAKTCRSQTLKHPASGKSLKWVFDENGELRAMTLASSSFWADTTTLSHWYRPSLEGSWEKLLDFKIGDEPWQPMAVDAAGKRLIVASRENRDTLAVFSYDPARRAPGEMLAGHPTEDIAVHDDLRSRHYESIVTLGMKPRQHWFDERWASLQAAIDKALPMRINRISGDPQGMVLVYSYADVDPGRWLLLNSKTMSMRPLTQRRPGIDSAQMRPMEVIQYPAKDGLAIPAFVTRPEGPSTPRPMVVVIHGGPAARDYWAWNAEVQLFATRGYVVFQPQFRGSTGFGKAFEQAGIGQWGLSMQDDITAGVEHLIKEGIADPNRICIYGTSYGGYAAVWGLIKTPQLYRCGVTLAGVTDIGERLTDWSDTNSDRLSRELLRFHIRQQGVGTLDEVSPVKHAHRIQAPVLIAHGELDKRVPVTHAKRLMAELNQHGKPFEWLPFGNEGHSIRNVLNVQKFSRALLQFIEKHIGDPAQAKPGP